MHMTFPDSKPAGLVVRTTQHGKSLSLWQGAREMIAELSQEQAGTVAHALTMATGATQIVGQVSEFQVRNLSE